MRKHRKKMLLSITEFTPFGHETADEHRVFIVSGERDFHGATFAGLQAVGMSESVQRLFLLCFGNATNESAGDFLS